MIDEWYGIWNHGLCDRKKLLIETQVFYFFTFLYLSSLLCVFLLEGRWGWMKHNRRRKWSHYVLSQFRTWHPRSSTKGPIGKPLRKWQNRSDSVDMRVIESSYVPLYYKFYNIFTILWWYNHDLWRRVLIPGTSLSPTIVQKSDSRILMWNHKVSFWYYNYPLKCLNNLHWMSVLTLQPWFSEN